MSAFGDCLRWQRKTTSVEGRHCICSEHPVFEMPPSDRLQRRTASSSGDTWDKEVNRKLLTEKSHYSIV